MKREILFTISCSLLVLLVNAQETILTEINTPLLQKYIDLAKQNYPRKKIFTENIVAAQSKIQTASMGYFEALNASYIYRPADQVAINLDNPFVVNGFQFGVNLNLGTFLKTPSLVKQSRQALKVAVLEDKEFTNSLQIQVKNRYFEYIQAISDLKLKTQAFADNKTTSDNLRYRFEKGEVSLDVYNSGKSATTFANTGKLAAELNLLKTKNALEELVGDKLESVK